MTILWGDDAWEPTHQKRFLYGTRGDYKRRTHCRRGHKMDAENVYLEPHRRDGKLEYFRKCKVCKKISRNKRECRVVV